MLGESVVKEKIWTTDWFRGFAAGAAALFVLELLIAQFVWLSGHPTWVKLILPGLLLAVAAFLLRERIQIRIPEKFGEKLKQPIQLENPETSRLQGLAFQGQGELDQAFEKFKRILPVDNRVLDLLYNLALEFERKRQFGKAEAVYQYIAQTNPEYRDVPLKLSRAKKLSESLSLDSSGSFAHAAPAAQRVAASAMATATASAAAAATSRQQAAEKPMLGRYQVEKELGKGAMGIVYLGRDPKIGRTVAIKTMALSVEFEADELNDVKSRFFREAETAGRLSHPNIVQIFDAGEEHSLAYIAMEYVNGVDLSRNVKSGNLLPPRDILKYIADAADALEYAHGNGVVHRDIKPANMMLLAEVHTIKLMDFGIARLADSTKTKTGMVLGTPSYMSPEQLSGKPIDGRSDLFSLGVTMYQLLTGSLPFQAESMATLMFKIANEPHKPACTIRPDLPPQIDVILNRALHKNAESRYGRGGEMARDIRVILNTLS